MRWSCVLVALLGCASAGNGGGGGADGSVHNDGNNSQRDAPVSIDGPRLPVSVTLTQTNDTAVAAAASIACSNTGTGNTYDNIWYRAFQLSDYGIAEALSITSVTFGVQEAANTQPVTVKIGSYSGTIGGSTITLGQITPIAMASAAVPATATGELVNANISATIPANGKFVVQVSAPDINATGYIYIGATTAGEVHPAYLTSTACGISAPQTTVATGGTGQVIITVTGTH